MSLKIRPNAAWQQLDDGMVLLDTGRGRYFELNATASRMFELIAAGKPKDDIVEQVVADFEVDAATAAQDLDMTLAKLHKLGFIDKP